MSEWIGGNGVAFGDMKLVSWAQSMPEIRPPILPRTFIPVTCISPGSLLHTHSSRPCSIPPSSRVAPCRQKVSLTNSDFGRLTCQYTDSDAARIGQDDPEDSEPVDNETVKDEGQANVAFTETRPKPD